MKQLFTLALCIVGLISTSFAQYGGTLSFSVYPNQNSGSFGNDHYIAIWIENDSGVFVKTKLKLADTHGTTSHLGLWKTSSSGNVVDAVTGASLSNYSSPCTITWDATDVSGNIVPDGTYKIRVEFTWSHGGSTADAIYTFNKSNVTDSQTPADISEFNNATIDWEPDLTSVSEMEMEEDYIVYPNPVKDNIRIIGKNISEIKVYNMAGKLISTGNLKYIDMAGQPNGLYLVSIMNDKGIFYEKVTKQ